MVANKFTRFKVAAEQRVNNCVDCGVPCSRYAARCRSCWLSKRQSEDDIWTFMNFQPDDSDAPLLGYCWEYNKDTTHQYGRISMGRGNRERVHRIAYRTVYGTAPKKLFVCHHCDNPVCIRPSHLFLGTHSDNNLDARQKKRHAYGSRHGHAKLTESQVPEIFRLHQQGLTGRAIAVRFSVSPSTVCHVLNKKNWNMDE